MSVGGKLVQKLLSDPFVGHSYLLKTASPFTGFQRAVGKSSLTPK